MTEAQRSILRMKNDDLSKTSMRKTLPQVMACRKGVL